MVRTSKNQHIVPEKKQQDPGQLPCLTGVALSLDHKNNAKYRRQYAPIKKSFKTIDYTSNTIIYCAASFLLVRCHFSTNKKDFHMTISKPSVSIFSAFILGLSVFFNGNANNQNSKVLTTEYETLSAQEKQDILWKAISESPYPKNLIPVLKGNLLKVLNPRFAAKAFTNMGDEFPGGREKAIHANGIAGKVEWVPSAEQNTYTGILKTGAIGIVRFSLANTPAKDKFTPALAVKLLIDNQPSTNLFALNSLEGQGTDHNFFAHTLTTWLPNPESLVIKAGAKVFDWARSLFTHAPQSSFVIPLVDISSVSREGLPVDERDIQAPVALMFVPNKELRNMFKNTTKDFRANLMTIPAQTVLYSIYTTTQGGHKPKVLLGSLVLKSELVASEYEDKKLYFKHPRNLSRAQLLAE